MSKLVRKMPWEGPSRGEGDERPWTPMRLEDLPVDMRMMLIIRPRRNPNVEWEEDPDTGQVTIIYPKNLTTFERALAKMLRPVEEIRRPLDRPGSDIWRMCDGANTIADICTVIDDVYKEEMEPVLKRVVGFIEGLAKRGLVTLGRDALEAQEEG